MYAVISKVSDLNISFLGIVAGEHGEVLSNWLLGNTHHRSINLQDIPTITFTSNNPVSVTGMTWTRSILRLDSYYSTWRWAKSPTKMPPVRGPSYRSAALTATTGPTFDCVGFSDNMVPVLRLHHHQAADHSTYSLPCDIFRLATYTTRPNNATYNLVVSNNYRADSDDDQDDSPPPRPPRDDHDDAGAAAPLIQV